MISTETLRRYRFCSFMTPAQLREVAMISEEFDAVEGDVLFHMGDEQRWLFLLQDGAVELHYIVFDENLPELRKDFLVGIINPGEVIGISAIIEPHVSSSTARVETDSRLLRMHAGGLRAICDSDSRFAYALMRQIGRVAKDRLNYTRVQLAAASTPLRPIKKQPMQDKEE